MKNNLPVQAAVPGSALLSFQVGNRRFAVPFIRVAEVRTLQTSIPMLQAPDYATGQVTLHGRPVPLIDLRVRVGEPPRFDQDTRLIVVFFTRLAADDGRVGLLVDSIGDVVELRSPPGSLPHPSAPSGKSFTTACADLSGAQLLLIDINRLVKTSAMAI